MIKDDIVFASLKDPSSKRISLWAWWGLALMIGLASRPAGLIFFACILIWRALTKHKLANFLFHRNSQFSSAMLELSQLEDGLKCGEQGNIFRFARHKQYGTLRSSEVFLIARDGGDALLITPEKYWARLDFRESTARTAQMAVEGRAYKASTENPTSWDEILRWEWQHKTRSGERDFRYKAEKDYQVLRFSCLLKVKNGQTIEFKAKGRADCEELCHKLQRLTSGAARPVELYRPEKTQKVSDSEYCGDDDDEDQHSDESSYESEDNESPEVGVQSNHRSWAEILGVPAGATKQKIKEARDRLVQGLHPDRLKAIEGLDPDIERYATQRLVEINLAYRAALSELPAR